MNRSLAALLEVIDDLCLDRNFAFQPHRRAFTSGQVIPVTLCSDAINALTVALGCTIPIDLDLSSGLTLANAQHDWLVGEPGKAKGWKPVDTRKTALERAMGGFPTVATWKNPTGGHGHIMLVRPNLKDPTRMYVAGAGSRTGGCIRIEDSFGINIMPDFCTHD